MVQFVVVVTYHGRKLQEEVRSAVRSVFRHPDMNLPQSCFTLFGVENSYVGDVEWMAEQFPGK